MEEIKNDNVEEQKAADVAVAAPPPPPAIESTEKGKDTGSNVGKITNIDEVAKRPIKKDFDVSQLPNQKPKYKELLDGKEDPKKLIGKGVRDVEKGIQKYYDQGNIEALQQFVRNFMYFPRDLVRIARGYLEELQNKDKSQLNKESLDQMNVREIFSIGSKMGLHFASDRDKADMIKDILDMQAMTRRRKQI